MLSPWLSPWISPWISPWFSLQNSVKPCPAQALRRVSNVSCARACCPSPARETDVCGAVGGCATAPELHWCPGCGSGCGNSKHRKKKNSIVYCCIFDIFTAILAVKFWLILWNQLINGAREISNISFFWHLICSFLSKRYSNITTPSWSWHLMTFRDSPMMFNIFQHLRGRWPPDTTTQKWRFIWRVLPRQERALKLCLPLLL